MDKKTKKTKQVISPAEKEGLIRATDYVLDLFEDYIKNDIKYDDIDWDEHFKQGEPITLDQLRHFFVDRADWFFTGSDGYHFLGETDIETWGNKKEPQESVPLYQRFVGEK